MKLESKTGRIPFSDERIYNFLTDFNNFKHLVPKDKIRDWQSDENSCRFSIDFIGAMGVKIIEKEPFTRIKLSGIDDNKYSLAFLAELNKLTDNETAIKFTLEADLNPMLQMMAKKPLQDFLDRLVDQLSGYSF